MHSDIVIDSSSLGNIFKDYLEDTHRHREGYLAFGWGDRATYLNTPMWGDIELTTTLKALFINTPSVVHVHFYQEIKTFQNLKKVKLSYEEKELLIKSIFKSFDIKKIEKEKSQGYGKNDFFYPSIYQYNLFNTCNTWTGERLKESNISISYWTPFSYNIIDSLP
jgi:uncharacterized protein (TIGR02117 family)